MSCNIYERETVNAILFLEFCSQGGDLESLFLVVIIFLSKWWFSSFSSFGFQNYEKELEGWGFCNGD